LPDVIVDFAKYGCCSLTEKSDEEGSSKVYISGGSRSEDYLKGN
jgi:hypothetical protein